MAKDNKCCESSMQGNEKIMIVKWQRLVSDGATCPRCGGTEQELAKAIKILSKSLSPLGIQVVLEKDSLSIEEFKKNPLSSNRIWINNKPLEDYIMGDTGKSPCCDVCGPVECRTLKVEKEIYEVIPSDLIIRAGLVAASQMITSAEN